MNIWKRLHPSGWTQEAKYDAFMMAFTILMGSLLYVFLR